MRCRARGVLLGLLVAAGCGGPTAPPTSPAPTGVALGRPAPELVGTDLDGRPISLSDFRGKVVLLDFWQQH